MTLKLEQYLMDRTFIEAKDPNLFSVSGVPYSFALRGKASFPRAYVHEHCSQNDGV